TGSGPVAPLVQVSDPAVVVEAVKLARDGSGDVIVRLYESRGGRARAEVTPGFETTGAAPTDLLERPVAAGDVRARGVQVRSDGRVDLQVRPFQILTLRFTRS